MESEKDEVSLVVEGGDLSTHKLGVLRKESGQQSADAVAQTCGEVVEDHLWRVLCGLFTPSLQRESSCWDHTAEPGAPKTVPLKLF